MQSLVVVPNHSILDGSIFGFHILTINGMNIVSDIGLAVVPVVWIRLGELIPLRFLSGFIGYKQDPRTLEICPNVG